MQGQHPKYFYLIVVQLWKKKISIALGDLSWLQRGGGTWSHVGLARLLFYATDIFAGYCGPRGRRMESSLELHYLSPSVHQGQCRDQPCRPCPLPWMDIPFPYLQEEAPRSGAEKPAPVQGTGQQKGAGVQLSLTWARRSRAKLRGAQPKGDEKNRAEQPRAAVPVLEAAIRNQAQHPMRTILLLLILLLLLFGFYCIAVCLL